MATAAAFVSSGTFVVMRGTCTKFATMSSPQKTRKLMTSCCYGGKTAVFPSKSAVFQLPPSAVFPSKSAGLNARHQLIGGIRTVSNRNQSKTVAAAAAAVTSPEKNFCWNCKASYDDDDVTSNDVILVCKKCGVLRPPPENLNYFALFGIPVTFKMDLKGLANKHKKMQMLLHPDRFAALTGSEGAEERALSDTWSPLANEAYAVLKKPIRRANYLLALHNRPLREGEGELLGLDANFLAEMVELNEEIEEAEGQTDVAGLMRHVREVLQTLYDKAEAAFETNDLDKARMVTAQMRYYENLKKKLVERETEMGMIR